MNKLKLTRWKVIAISIGMIVDNQLFPHYSFNLTSISSVLLTLADDNQCGTKNGYYIQFEVNKLKYIFKSRLLHIKRGKTQH